jgi:hypothetical protein
MSGRTIRAIRWKGGVAARKSAARKPARCEERADPVDRQRARDPGRGRGQARRAHGRLALDPVEERREPVHERRLVDVDLAVEVGDRPVAGRVELAGDLGVAVLVRGPVGLLADEAEKGEGGDRGDEERPAKAVETRH